MIFGVVDDFWPAHLAAVSGHVELRIMALDGMKKTYPGDTEWSQGISRLESALRTREETVTPDELPLRGYQDAGLDFWGKQKRIEGKAWTGLRWIAWYSQGGLDTPDPIPLNYVFEAISRDGRYFIMVFANVEYTNPPEELLKILRERSQLGGSAQSMEAFEGLLRSFQPRVCRRLDAAEPDSLKPSVRRLDALVSSIELK